MAANRDGIDFPILISRYFYQEVLRPLKGLGRYLFFGVIGSLLFGMGLLFLSIGMLKGLQEVEVFANRLSWAPYLVTFFALIVMSLSVVKFSKGKPRDV